MLTEWTGQKNVKQIIVACDAGIASSVIGATILRNKLKNAGLDISVVHTPIEQIPADAQIIISHEKFTPQARNMAPNAEHISIKNFINDPQYDLLVNRLKG
ncbi:hypothetical protein GND95_12380 [Defluviitalea raffinosedens]|uniref:PTS EIIB type-2 domain-containing protein n=1 Tax=Defluviitalea raffinosedens TaxID=1450156 RepID=A0A7C8LC92_9FIRM|nr:hypothetical protein [Defluviitalea raffinosedens]KAE9630213.1 hypothetical protein GND95_12380 [Defluviitalea raffinosedens]HHW67738.1 hypothetical protein [Candidatus Epulonipiscium sp.]